MNATTNPMCKCDHVKSEHDQNGVCLMERHIGNDPCFCIQFVEKAAKKTVPAPWKPRAPRKSNIQAVKTDVSKVGSCQFCNNAPKMVTVINSKDRFCTAQVRMCDACLRELTEATK